MIWWDINYQPYTVLIWYEMALSPKMATNGKWVAKASKSGVPKELGDRQSWMVARHGLQRNFNGLLNIYILQILVPWEESNKYGKNNWYVITLVEFYFSIFLLVGLGMPCRDLYIVSASPGCASGQTGAAASMEIYNVQVGCGTGTVWTWQDAFDGTQRTYSISICINYRYGRNIYIYVDTYHSHGNIDLSIYLPIYLSNLILPYLILAYLLSYLSIYLILSYLIWSNLAWSDLIYLSNLIWFDLI
jgi:hypothetical protein